MFSGDGPSGIAWRGGVIQGSDEQLYGSIVEGGSARVGSVYASTLTGDVSILHEFLGPDGLYPVGELFETAPGRFIGVSAGLADPSLRQFGSIFEITSDGAFSSLHRFSYFDGATPWATLMRASDGVIYGTTFRGGPLGGGVIFRIVPAAVAAR